MASLECGLATALQEPQAQLAAPNLVAWLWTLQYSTIRSDESASSWRGLHPPKKRQQVPQSKAQARVIHYPLGLFLREVVLQYGMVLEISRGLGFERAVRDSRSRPKRKSKKKGWRERQPF